MTNSLASSRKAWAVLQSLIGRVVYGSKYNELDGGDKITIPTQSAADHPWKFTRTGNLIRFSPGIVQGVGTSSIRRVITDAGGYEYTPTSDGGAPVYLYLLISATPSSPFLVETDNGLNQTSYVVAPSEQFSEGAKGDTTYSPPPGGENRWYWAEPSLPFYSFDLSFIPPDITTSEYYACVPFLYITDTETIQLIDKNVQVMTLGANRNAYLWP